MNITIDCRMIGASGVGTYLAGCLPIFLKSENKFLLLGDKNKISPFINANNSSIEECHIEPFSPAEFFFPRSLLNKINQTGIYYSPYFNIPSGIKIPVMVTIHDIVFPDVPGLVSPVGLWARMYFYRRAAKHAKKIITVSDFSKERIEYHLGNKTPVINASNAINILSIDNKQQIKKEKLILFIGNIKKHKGLGILLDAFNKFLEKNRDYKMVIIGSKDNFRSKDTNITERLEKLSGANLEFTGFIPENEKNLLLAKAALLVQPSLYEGFGYPPLEAMLSGTPALISNIPVFKEIYDDFPVTFFKSGDSEDLSVKMLALLLNKTPASINLPNNLKEKYSFKNTVSIILAEMEKIYTNQEN